MHLDGGSALRRYIMEVRSLYSTSKLLHYLLVRQLAYKVAALPILLLVGRTLPFPRI